MAGDHWAAGDGEQLRDPGMAEMGDVDDHALVFHPPGHFEAEGGDPAFLDAVHRSSQLIVKEVRQPGHAEPGGIEPVKVFGLALKIV